MKNQITRRTLMTAAPAVALCGAAPAAQPDPFLVHYRQWIEARKIFNQLSYEPGNEHCDSPESDAAAAAEIAAYDEIAGIIPTTQEGLAALTHVIWDWHGSAALRGTASYEEECENPDNKIILNLYSALSGGHTMPAR